MSAAATCTDGDAARLLDGYLSGRLGPGEMERFEAHLFECDRCIEDVRLGAGVRRALRDLPGEAEPTRRPARPWIVAAVAAVAASMAVVLLPPGGDSALRPLGQVSQPPLYLGVPVRGGSAGPDAAFAEAMDQYTAGSYRQAVEGLQEALERGAPPVPTGFFLGATLLMLGEPEAAAERFDAVTAVGDSPYLAEAHYYRAKSLLQLGRRSAALDALRAASAAGGRIAPAAAALADSVARTPDG